MRSLRRPAAVFIAIALAGGLAACGDDEDDEETGGQTATTTATTPTGSDSVSIGMTEYAYTVGGDLNAGGTIRLSNTGKEIHMIGLAKLKEDKTIADVVALLQETGPEEGEPTTTVAGGAATTTTAASSATTTAGSEEGEGEGEGDPFAEVFDGELGAPGSFMFPGQSADITVPTLGEGSYAMICFLPVEGETTPHFARGMVGELTVVGEQASVPTADTTFRLESGKPITGPSTLTAGRHIIKFEAAAGSEQLEPGMAKLDPGKTIADINQAFESFEQGEDFLLPVGAASLIPGDIIVGLFDLGDAKEVYVGVDLTAGTYAIDAHDTDVEDAPLDPVETITFTVT